MSSKTRYVKLDPELSDRFSNYVETEGYEVDADAHRKLIDEGLRSMGYQPIHTTSAERWLTLTRGVGSVLGLTALVLLGLGVFLGPSMNRFGFGLSVAAIAFLAGAEIADRHGTEIYAWLKDAAQKEARQWLNPPEEGDA